MIQEVLYFVQSGEERLQIDFALMKNTSLHFLGGQKPIQSSAMCCWFPTINTPNASKCLLSPPRPH